MKKRKTRHIRFPLSPQHCCVLQAHPSLRSSVGAGSPGDRKDSGNPTTKLHFHQHFLKPLMVDYVGDTMWGNLLRREASSAGLSIPCSVYLTLPNIGFRLLKTSSWTEMDVISWRCPARGRCHSALQHPHLVVRAGASPRAAGTPGHRLQWELPSSPG